MTVCIRMLQNHQFHNKLVIYLNNEINARICFPLNHNLSTYNMQLSLKLFLSEMPLSPFFPSLNFFFLRALLINIKCHIYQE